MRNHSRRFKSCPRNRHRRGVGVRHLLPGDATTEAAFAYSGHLIHGAGRKWMLAIKRRPARLASTILAPSRSAIVRTIERPSPVHRGRQCWSLRRAEVGVRRREGDGRWTRGWLPTHGRRTSVVSPALSTSATTFRSPRVSDWISAEANAASPISPRIDLFSASDKFRRAFCIKRFNAFLEILRLTQTAIAMAFQLD